MRPSLNSRRNASIYSGEYESRRSIIQEDSFSKENLPLTENRSILINSKRISTSRDIPFSSYRRQNNNMYNY